MATTKVTGQIGPNMLSGAVNTDDPIFTNAGAIPGFPAIAFDFGASLGSINLIAYRTGTAAAAVSSVDLSAVPDTEGTNVNFARVRAVMFLNRATVDTAFLLVDGSVTNGWKALFNNIATAKLLIPPGRLLTSGILLPGGALVWAPNLTGLVTSGTSKVISLDPGAATIPWTVALLGVNA